MSFYGMFDPQCTCGWCRDRCCKYNLEQQYLSWMETEESGVLQAPGVPARLPRDARSQDARPSEVNAVAAVNADEASVSSRLPPRGVDARPNAETPAGVQQELVSSRLPSRRGDARPNVEAPGDAQQVSVSSRLPPRGVDARPEGNLRNSQTSRLSSSGDARNEVQMQAAGGVEGDLQALGVPARLPRDARTQDARPQYDAHVDAVAVFRWIQQVGERYMVRRPFYNDILTRMGKVVPTVDSFADAQLHLLTRWWGPGSDVPNAFDVPWGSEALLWCNPPFSRMGEVVAKIKLDQARAVLIAPNWKNQDWFDELPEITIKRYFYPKGTRMFEVEDGPVGGTPWPVWALLVDGAKCWNPQQLEEEGYLQNTEAKGRRKRRKAKTDAEATSNAKSDVAGATS